MNNSIRRAISALLLSGGLVMVAFVIAQSVQAQVAQPQAQEYYGRILGNGVIGSGNSWIASVDHPSTGVYIVHFKEDNGAGRVPNCVCTGENTIGGVPVIATVENNPLNGPQSTNQVRVRITNAATLGLGQPIDRPFRIQCSPEQAATWQVAKFAVTPDGTCTIVLGDDWLNACIPLGTGGFDVFFSKNYSPTPSCLATTTPISAVPLTSIQTIEFADRVRVLITGITSTSNPPPMPPTLSLVLSNQSFKIGCYGSQP